MRRAVYRNVTASAGVARSRRDAPSARKSPTVGVADDMLAVAAESHHAAPKICLVDMDGVLADFVAGFRAAWARAGHGAFPEVTQWDLRAHVAPELHWRVARVMRTPGLFWTLPVMPGARAAIAALRARPDVEVVVCSSPVAGHHECVAEKLGWLRTHFPGLEYRAVFTHDKTLIRGAVLIDDKPEIRGAVTPEWRHLLYDAAYNRHVTDRARITWADWEGVLGWQS